MLHGRITSVENAGVRLIDESGTEVLVPWDRVRDYSVTPVDPESPARLARAAAIWRGRSRVERGDTALAEPVLAPLFESMRGESHETALVVAEGLLRCRLARHDQIGAVLPALETARLRRAGITSKSYALLLPVIDPATGLCPALPPVWTHARGLDRLARELETFRAEKDLAVEEIARAYRMAALSTLEGDEMVGGPEARPHTPGAQLVAQMAACGIGAADHRERARQFLLKRTASLEPWAEAWARFAIGRSLLREHGVEARRRGMVQLAHLPALHAADQRTLTALAVAHLAAALEQDGAAAEAAALRAELEQDFPAALAREALRAAATGSPAPE
jgi:hypothetical protein